MKTITPNKAKNIIGEVVCQGDGQLLFLFSGANVGAKHKKKNRKSLYYKDLRFL